MKEKKKRIGFITVQILYPEAQIAVDEIEGGGSLRLAWHAANAYRETVQKESVSFSVVYTLLKKLRPKNVMIETKRQGSNNVESNICKARNA